MKAATKKSKRSLPLLALISAGLVYMLFCIFQMQKSATNAESYSLLATRYSFGELIRNSINDSMSPVYLSVLKIWLHFFGHTDVSARALSMLLGAIILVEVYLIFKYRFSKKAALWAVVLFASSPVFIWAGCEATCIAYYVFLFLAAFYLFLILKHSKRKWWPLPLTAMIVIATLAFLIVLSERQGVFLTIAIRVVCLYLIFLGLSSRSVSCSKIAYIALISITVLNTITLPNINAIRGLSLDYSHGRELYGDMLGVGAEEPIICSDVQLYKEIAPYVDAVYLEEAYDAEVYRSGRIEEIPADRDKVWVLANDKDYTLEGWERRIISNLEYDNETYYLGLYQRE